MKLRVRENSIRLRLTRTEVDTFAKYGCIENKTEFGFADFVYALQTLNGIETLAATYIGNKMTVFMPTAMRTEWITTDVVGFGNDMGIGGGKSLFILVEKDWACTDNAVGEDQSDNFPNPNAAC